MRTPRSKMLAVVPAILFSVFLHSAGCVYSPENDAWVDAHDLMFAGYAQHPLATLHIEAYDRVSGQWRVVATATSSAVPTVYGGTTLYDWSLQHFDMTTVDGWECYWSEGSWCTIPGGVATAEFRVREQGSDLPYLATFDARGVACVMRNVARGMDWLTAGTRCASPESPVVTLRMLT